MNNPADRSSFIDRLKHRWGITSSFQVVIILVVFAFTGFSVLYAEEVIFEILNIPAENSWWVRVLLFLFITLPLYNLLLLFWGLVFGQFRFFWNFEKRFFGRMVFWRKKS